MSATTRIVLLAIMAGALGLGFGFLASGGGRSFLLRALETDTGQQAVARSASSKNTSAPALLGAARPELALPDLEGRARNLDQFGSRPLLINFMASWCGPCREELPELDRFAATQSADGIQVIGIAVENATAAHSLLTAVPVKFPVLIAGDTGIERMPAFGNASGTLPYSVLVGADGRLRARKIGAFAPGTIEPWIHDALPPDSSEPSQTP